MPDILTTEVVSRPHYTKQTRLSDGLVISSSAAVDYAVVTQSRTGSELKGWKQMIRDRKGATTALTAQRETITLNSGFLEFHELNDNGDKILHRTVTNNLGWNLSLLKPPTMLTSVTAAAEAAALQKYYNRLQDVSKALQGQVMAGEIRQTIQLLKHPFKQGITLLTSLLRNASTFRSMARNSGALWLQYRFGILPLISDIEGILKIVRATHHKESVDSFRAYGMKEQSVSELWTGSSVYGTTQTGTLETTMKSECIIRFGVFFEATGANPRQEALSDAFLNPRDLPGTAWELIPFSFLIDYFLNIGSIINAATTYTGNVVWTSKSVITTTESHLNIYAAKGIATRYKIAKFEPVVAQRTLRKVVRSTAPPGIPPLVFELPGSDIKLLNIAALLMSLLKGK